MTRLVYLSPVPWASFAQRPHKFVEWFHERTGGSVLWVDPYPTRFPNMSDLRRLRSIKSFTQSIGTPTWLNVIKLGWLPVEPIPGSGWLNGFFWRTHLLEIANFASQPGTLLAIGKPSVLGLKLLHALPHCFSIYDAMDDFPSFYNNGFSRFALARRERLIAQHVDVVLASSSLLKSRWVPINKDVRLVLNGMDLSATKLVAAKHLSSDKKVFGYVGTISSWFDWDWVGALARVRPNDEIRLIGPVLESATFGQLPENVKLLPACAHALALQAMAQFDVGLIPFKKNALTASVDPIKYYEYRALGLPVISTNFGEMSTRSSEKGVFISYSESDVSDMAQAALQNKYDEGTGQDFIEANNWMARFDEAKLLS